MDLSPYYREDDFRLSVYEKIADIVLQAALARRQSALSYPAIHWSTSRPQR
jgi:hypothetical protein